MASMTDTSTNRTQAWRERKAKEGAISVQFTLLPKDGDALVMMRRLLLDHGGPKAAVLYLLRQAAGRNDPTDQELMAMLAARLKAKADDRPVRPEPVSAAKRTRKSS